MSDIAIRVEKLSKQYRIGTRRNTYKTLRDTLADTCSVPLRWMGKLLHGQRGFVPEADATIWALRDVSFEIKHGEVTGIIGRNGAGKSTLLKILSRITEPTAGHAEVYGRIGSLLEVGTGFHPELTGRENIYLNGAILGMKRTELKRKFDEIVAFAEIEQFIDTPVKHYSSGMYVRLAFSVAAHLEPEILLVDEVLAVGDMAFQKKCLGKMEDVAQKGRTVLLVSHNMLSIQSLCTQAMLLKDGTVNFHGAAEEAVTRYLAHGEQLSAEPLVSREDREGGERFRFANVRFLHPETLQPLEVMISGQPVMIRISYINQTTTVIKDVGIGISFFTLTGAYLCACRSRAIGVTFDVSPAESYIDCLIPRWPLSAGPYTYRLFAEYGGTFPLDHVEDAGSIQVEAGDYYGSGILPGPGHRGVFIDYSYEKCTNDIAETLP